MSKISNKRSKKCSQNSDVLSESVDIRSESLNFQKKTYKVTVVACVLYALAVVFGALTFFALIKSCDPSDVSDSADSFEEEIVDDFLGDSLESVFSDSFVTRV